MNIREAMESDIPRLKALLLQVLNIHAEGRPDLFIPDTTKYDEQELQEMIHDSSRPVFVITDDTDTVMGYAMCEIRGRAHSSNMTDIKTLYIDDLCVDASARNSHYGRHLYERVKEYAASIGAYHITLNVWCCNSSAIGFYKAMGLTPMCYTMEEILPE